MRILLASSEVQPYSKSGGLADMVGALAKAFGRGGHQVGVVTPLYQGIMERYPEIQRMDWFMELPLGGEKVQAEIWTLAAHPNVTIYFVHQPRFFYRKELYQEGGQGYADNAHRYIFFSKAVVHLARYLPWQPEVLHVHDWQTALCPLFLLHQKLTEGWRTPPRTCLTIHNLAYQGHFDRHIYELANLPLDYFNPAGVEFYGGLNFLKAGIIYADTITTVSPRYAREIMTPEFGCALDGDLRQRRGAVFGILNGVDYEDWKTTANPHLTHSYSSDDLVGKAAQKLDLQEELGLPVDPRVPLFGNITRLADQKGVDILLGALEEMLSSQMQFMLLGSGNPYFEEAYRRLAWRFPKKVAVRIGFNEALSHRIEAGSDFFLMPSRFEPCGLNQMYSLRYGTVPIVRAVGGLDDTVIDAADDARHPNGIKFREFSVRALARAIRKALDLFAAPEALELFRRNGMEQDFSWARTMGQYLAVYQGQPPDAVHRVPAVSAG